jgi:peptide deformylase
MKIIYVPDKKLRKSNQSIIALDKKNKKLIGDLIKTINDPKSPEGVGLAAPQVGKNFKIFVTKFPKDKIRTYINPEIVEHSSKKILMEDEFSLEGCLSIPNIYGYVFRWQKIKLKYQVIEDDKLVDKLEEFEDYRARVVQHENDHLNGILFTDHVLQERNKFFIMEKNKFVRCRDYQILASLI